jgi:Glucanosyltransferase
MEDKGGRYIPIGYSAADISSIRPMFQDYLVCGSTNSTIDFFAVNIYEWVLHQRSLVNVVWQLNIRNFRLRRPYERAARLSSACVLVRRWL